MTSTPRQRQARLALWMAELESKLADKLSQGLPETLDSDDDEHWQDRMMADFARSRALALTLMAQDLIDDETAETGPVLQ